VQKATHVTSQQGNLASSVSSATDRWMPFLCLIYINEAIKSNYPMMLTGPPSFSSRLISFSEDDAFVMHFSHNDALIITMHIDSYESLEY